MDGMTNDPFGAMLKEFLDSQDNMSSTEDTTFTSMISTIDITDGTINTPAMFSGADINEYYLWVLASIGVPANVLVILTILTMQVVSPVTFFIAVLAFSDGSALVLKLIFNQMSRTVMVTKVFCKLNFLPIFMSSLANWMLALICAERFISVCFPLKKMYLVTKRRGYVAVLVTALMLLAIFMFFFLYMYTRIAADCSPNFDFFWFWGNIFYWINASLTVFLPFSCILTFTCFIVRGLRLSRAHRRSLLRKENVETNETRGSFSQANEKFIHEAEKVEHSITLMMILASALFLVLTLPACVFYISEPYLFDEINPSEKYLYFKMIQHILYDSSHAFNFLLYFFTAKRFRQHFLHLLLCQKLRRRFSKNQATTRTTASDTSRESRDMGASQHTNSSNLTGSK
ncbi:alpha-1A adrenergic receptor-like isoform X1 [Physella acuta]|uniref:alpha-1A adrenergic receptor-like isoform X1 n=1 Tax=Physella acuta TaxID=109671 RepID=UPI0027DE3998|nr:alpha-1A adrenergic receptor-like isoform X1 [Physella acuta]XP_059144295.1 alpha-1A adrenergic receptor-like isoform X1 [Physella acuta]